MFKLLAFTVCLALVAAQQQPEKYPAGVDPHKCPNFPICDNAALHNQAPANHWAPQPYAQPSWNHQPAPQQHWQPAPQQHWQPAPQQHWQPAPAAYHQPAPQHAQAAKYPAGVDPNACPNYPYCDHSAHAGHVRANPLPGFTERLYPAGVSAAQCPNYPEC